MSLADELLADLDSGSEGEDVRIKAEEEAELEMGGGAEMLDAEIDGQDADDIRLQEFEGILQNILPLLRSIGELPADPPSIVQGNVEDDPEYRLIVSANLESVEIEEQIMKINRFIRNHYAKRFEELDSLIVNPLDYARAVKALGNNISTKDTNLHGIVSKETLMVIAISSTTTKGVKLEDVELERIYRACDIIFQLDAARRSIMAYVQSRMDLFAPNTTAIVGSSTTAKLIGITGGLRGLANYANSNLPALGAKRATQTGLSTGVGIRQQGFLYQCDLIQQTPPDLRRKMMRVVSGKVVLAARMDVDHAYPDGSQGEKWREHCEKQIERLTEAAPTNQTKALPAPIEKAGKRRGGRRARREKEKWAMTDLRKAQNRIAFGKEEQSIDVGDESVGLGMIGKDSGRVRAMAIDNRTRAKLPKAKAGFKAPLNGSGGMESSLAFTAGQGLELVDPSTVMKRKAADGGDRWFSNGTFGTISKKQKTNGEAK